MSAWAADWEARVREAEALPAEVRCWPPPVRRTAEGRRHPAPREADAAERYRRRIHHERTMGLAYVGDLLDQLCYDLGMDPLATWRAPRAWEAHARRNRAALRVAQHASAGVLDPNRIGYLGGHA